MKLTLQQVRLAAVQLLCPAASPAFGDALLCTRPATIVTPCRNVSILAKSGCKVTAAIVPPASHTHMAPHMRGGLDPLLRHVACVLVLCLQLNREIRRLQRRLFQGGDTHPLVSSTDAAAVTAATAAGGDPQLGCCAQAAVAAGVQQPQAAALDQLLALAFQAVGDAVVQSLHMQQEQDQPQRPTQAAASAAAAAGDHNSSSMEPPRAAVLEELEQHGTSVSSLSQLQSVREQLDQQVRPADRPTWLVTIELMLYRSAPGC